MKRVELHPLATRELREATHFYNQKAPGLGSSFLDIVWKGIGLIAEHPQAAPLVGASVRRRSIPRFPYGILYVVEEDRIRVVAIAHRRREPGYWLGRIRES